VDVVGYCTIKKDADGQSAISMDHFRGQDVRVMEFASDGGVLVINSEATGVAMFDKEHISRKFECGLAADVVTPPGLNLVEQTLYVGKVLSRKGGYNLILKNMVIQASLAKGKFNDGFLFAVQEQEAATERSRKDKMQSIKNRVAKGEKTTFAERNILNIENKKSKKINNFL
jgi:hypothetical protein